MLHIKFPCTQMPLWIIITTHLRNLSEVEITLGVVKVDKAKSIADLLHIVLLLLFQAPRSLLGLILSLVGRASLLFLTMTLKVPLVPLGGFFGVELMATISTWLIRV